MLDYLPYYKNKSLTHIGVKTLKVRVQPHYQFFKIQRKIINTNQNTKEKTKLNTWRRYGENKYNDIHIYAAMITVSITFRKLSGNM